MQTYSGRRYYPLDPKPSEIESADIAHALSLLCRYGGHIDRFYSVAEHCVLLSYTVSPENALHALLHDATEAYVVDVPRPIKRYLPEYRELEDKVWQAIAERYGLSPEMPAEVTEHDTRILLNERATLFSHAELGKWTMDGMDPLDVDIYGLPSNEIETIYLLRLKELLNTEAA